MRYLFQIVSSFLIFTFHKVVWWCVWGVTGCLMTVSLHVYCWVWWWKNFENRPTFGEVMGKCRVSSFFLTRCVVIIYVHYLKAGCSGRRWAVLCVYAGQVLETLGSEQTMPSTAAQCVAYIACAELPEGSWPEMMTVLTTNVTNPNSTEMLKEASLEAVGYICQDIVCSTVF